MAVSSGEPEVSAKWKVQGGLLGLEGKWCYCLTLLSPVRNHQSHLFQTVELPFCGVKEKLHQRPSSCSVVVTVVLTTSIMASVAP